MVFVVVCVFFGLNNQAPISVNLNPLLANDITMEAYRIHFASFLIGASFAIFFFGFEYVRKSLEIRKLSKKLQKFEEEFGGAGTSLQPMSNSSRLAEIDSDNLATTNS